jgi:serine/threonine protein kinase
MLTLSRARSPNVVRLLEVIDDEGMDEDKLILVMEYCPGGQLLNWNP